MKVFMRYRCATDANLLEVKIFCDHKPITTFFRILTPSSTQNLCVLHIVALCKVIILLLHDFPIKKTKLSQIKFNCEKLWSTYFQTYQKMFVWLS